MPPKNPRPTVPDTELMKFACNENEKDVKHLLGK
jgi:hypothetical protein